MKPLVPTTSVVLAAALMTFGSLVGTARPAAASAECLAGVGDATQDYFNAVLEERTRVATIEAGGGTASSREVEKAAKAALLAAVREDCVPADLADFEAGSCGAQNPTLRKMVNCLAKHSNQAVNYMLASIFNRPVPPTPTPRPTPLPTTSVVFVVVTPTGSINPPQQTRPLGQCQGGGFGNCKPPLQCVNSTSRPGIKVCTPPMFQTPKGTVPTPQPTQPSNPPTPTPVSATPTPTPKPPTPTPTRTPTPSPCPVAKNPLQCIQQGGTIDLLTGCCILPN
jgi:hypothetical protein